MKRCSISIVIGLMLSLLLGLPMIGQAEEVSATIVLEQAAHFTSPDGNDLLVPAGMYRVAGDGDHLRLIREKEESILVIEAQKGSHDQSSDTSIAVTIQGEGEESDAVFVGLLMPDRTSLEATGSYSGVRGRGFRDRAQQFRNNMRQSLANTAANVRERVPQVAVALCKGALRTRPAAVPILVTAKAQAGHILQDRQFQQLAQEAVQTILRDKAEVIQRLVEEARFLTAPENRSKIASLLSGERICERPFQTIMGGIRQVYASIPRPRAVQPSPAIPGVSYIYAVGGEAEYIGGIQGAIGLIAGVPATSTSQVQPDFGRLFWSLGGTVVTDIGGSGGVKAGISFNPPPQGVENRFDLAVRAGGDTAVGGGVNLTLYFAWDSIREEWKTKRLKSLVPHLDGIEAAILASVSASPVTLGLDIGYTRVTRFTW
ncbi:MAG: hypothetical protein OEV08_02305 [Nitrospira sp.]|nr:hypothetical protein [Nitrospira sp.]